MKSNKVQHEPNKLQYKHKKDAIQTQKSTTRISKIKKDINLKNINYICLNKIQNLITKETKSFKNKIKIFSKQIAVFVVSASLALTNVQPLLSIALDEAQAPIIVKQPVGGTFSKQAPLVAYVLTRS
ncbi:MAG: hypothetical protein LBR30_04615, partial [Clostridioides sp.]|nr:hypothetical protein [Clostridioides sp.]